MNQLQYNIYHLKVVYSNSRVNRKTVFLTDCFLRVWRYFDKMFNLRPFWNITHIQLQNYFWVQDSDACCVRLQWCERFQWKQISCHGNAHLNFYSIRADWNVLDWEPSIDCMIILENCNVYWKWHIRSILAKGLNECFYSYAPDFWQQLNTGVR